MDLALNDHPLEIAADVIAAALLAAAMAFAGSTATGLNAFVTGLAAFVPLIIMLRRVRPDEPAYALPAFDLPDSKFETDELLLRSAMIFHTPGIGRDELVLDDVLARLGPESRVVRLFDPGQIPTPGELHASIDRHLRPPQRISDTPDASQALSDALAQLRQSLR